MKLADQCGRCETQYSRNVATRSLRRLKSAFAEGHTTTMPALEVESAASNSAVSHGCHVRHEAEAGGHEVQRPPSLLSLLQSDAILGCLVALRAGIILSICTVSLPDLLYLETEKPIERTGVFI